MSRQLLVFNCEQIKIYRFALLCCVTWRDLGWPRGVQGECCDDAGISLRTYTSVGLGSCLEWPEEGVNNVGSGFSLCQLVAPKCLPQISACPQIVTWRSPSGSSVRETLKARRPPVHSAAQPGSPCLAPRAWLASVSWSPFPQSQRTCVLQQSHCLRALPAVAVCAKGNHSCARHHLLCALQALSRTQEMTFT